jgi:hypothetical protein
MVHNINAKISHNIPIAIHKTNDQLAEVAALWLVHVAAIRINGLGTSLTPGIVIQLLVPLLKSRCHLYVAYIPNPAP